MGTAQENVRHYFRVKAAQLRAAAALPSVDHAGLSGSHREEFQRIYLREILPRRYEIGRGMVYGSVHRSREADIVVWDSANYPSLPMLDHSFFFAESVRAVIESKSRWSTKDFDDVLAKSKAVRDIVPHHGLSLGDEVSMLQLEVAALRAGREHDGMMLSKPHIGTAAVFLAGGSASLRDEGSISPEVVDNADDCWPDVMLLLGPGRVVAKEYQGDGQYLCFYELGDDALLFFTHAVLRLLADRIVATEAPFYLDGYAWEVLNVEPSMVIPFRATRFAPSQWPLWRE
ncbi:MAG TPA: DUF6602 domain-containing protein [Thermoleophilaceae bacterium]|jgi:hypothetical protein